jgi:hypothetical protein
VQIAITIIIIALVVAVLAYIVVKRRWDLLLRILFGLVTEAERVYGDKTGVLKFAKVVEWVLPYIPAILRPFLTEERLTNIINTALDTAKLKWNANPALVKRE